MTRYHVTPSSNVDSIRKNGLQPRIGERSLAAGEKSPAVFLFANKDDLEQALLSWLGEIFEDEDLVILEIQLPLEYKQFLVRNEYEITCSVAIPPQYIQIFDENTFF